MERRLRRVRNACKKMLHAFDAEAIHQFRVGIKKLRALFRLLNAGRKDKSFSIGKNLRSVYERSGIVRCLQLQQQTVVQLCRDLELQVPHAYLAALAVQESVARVKLKEQAKLVSFRTVLQKSRKQLEKKPDPATIENFVAVNKHALLKTLLASRRTDEDLHNLRKLLKDLIYVWPIISQAVNDVFPNGFITRENCLFLTERLGAFQDLCLLSLALEEAVHNPFRFQKERPVLKSLLLHVFDQKNRMKEEIENILNFLKREMEREDLLFPLYEYL